MMRTNIKILSPKIRKTPPKRRAPGGTTNRFVRDIFPQTCTFYIHQQMPRAIFSIFLEWKEVLYTWTFYPAKTHKRAVNFLNNFDEQNSL